MYQFKPSIVFIHTGGNDFYTNIFYTNQQLIKNVLNNIISIITICNKYNIKVIILLTPSSPQFSIKKRQFQIKLYDIIRKLSNCYILDVTKQLLHQFKQNNNVYKFDNIHLNSLGFKFLGKIINKNLSKLSRIYSINHVN